MSNIYLDPKEVLLKSADKQKQSDFAIQTINHIFVCVCVYIYIFFFLPSCYGDLPQSDKVLLEI